MAIATQDVRWRAIQAYRSRQGSQETIAKIFKISRRTLQLWLKKFNEENKLAPSPRGHNRPSFSGKYLIELDEYVTHQPDNTLEQIREHFAGRVNCSLPTIHNTLVRLGWVYKKSAKRHTFKPPFTSLCVLNQIYAF